jgi:adenylate cyclase
MFWSSYDVRKLYEPRKALEQSLDIDPNFARAYAVMANTYNAAWNLALDRDYLNPEARDRGLMLAQRAVQLDPQLPYAHAILAVALTWKGQNDAGLAAIQRAIALNPNYTDWRCAIVFVYGGDARRAVRLLLDHLRLDPFYPPVALSWLGGAHYMLKQYSEATAALKECVSRSPNTHAVRAWLAATYAQAGQSDLAKAEAAQVLRIEPDYTIDGVQRKLSSFKNADDTHHFFDGLRKAGLPER